MYVRLISQELLSANRFDVLHTSGELPPVNYLKSLKGETKAVIEYTNRYHEPFVKFLAKAVYSFLLSIQN